jgi:antitoxin ParD1/3/4
MNINFAPVDEAFIKRKVDEGYYTNATELIRDAIRRLREADTQPDPFVEAVMKGQRQIEEGKVLPFTPELHAQIIENAKKKAKTGAKLKPDVLP